MTAQNNRISYQAVVRDSTNHLVVNTPLTIQVKLTDSLYHTYSETHSVTSNPNGMISLWIGAGSSPSGNWNDIIWKKVEVESKIYRQSDGKLIVIHTMPLSAVPYALYAENVNEEVIETYVEMHQVQSDWNETNTSSKAYIKNKPDIPTVNDGHLDIILYGDTLTFTANQATNLMVNIDSVIQKLEEKITQLENEITFTCGTSKVKDLDGHSYETVVINSQCWTKTNMRTTQTASGVAITMSDTIPADDAPYVFKDTSSVANDSIQGYLYNFVAAMHICPIGWHLPTQADWETLKTYVGGESSYRCSANTEYLARAIASKTGWEGSDSECGPGEQPDENDGTGFSASPAGEFGTSGLANKNKEANFWLDQAAGSGVGICAFLRYNDPTLEYSFTPEQKQGFSVRCVHN